MEEGFLSKFKRLTQQQQQLQQQNRTATGTGTIANVTNSKEPKINENHIEIIKEEEEGKFAKWKRLTGTTATGTATSTSIATENKSSNSINKKLKKVLSMPSSLSIFQRNHKGVEDDDDDDGDDDLNENDEDLMVLHSPPQPQPQPLGPPEKQPELKDRSAALLTLSSSSHASSPTAKTEAARKVVEEKETEANERDQVLSIVIHKCDHLKPHRFLRHPFVRLHIIDIETGTYLKKSHVKRHVVYEHESNVEFIMPMQTSPCSLSSRPDNSGFWNEEFLLDEIYSYFIHPYVVFLFEIVDFVPSLAGIGSHHHQQQQYNTTRSNQKRINLNADSNDHVSIDGTYNVAWAFLKAVGVTGLPNTEEPFLRLQLYKYNHLLVAKSQFPNRIPHVFYQFQHLMMGRPMKKYSGTMTVTIERRLRPSQSTVVNRPAVVFEKERKELENDGSNDSGSDHTVTKESHDRDENGKLIKRRKAKMRRSNFSLDNLAAVTRKRDGNDDNNDDADDDEDGGNGNGNVENLIRKMREEHKWSRLASQDSKLPNKILSAIEAATHGCLAMQFSPCGEFLAVGCAGNDILNDDKQIGMYPIKIYSFITGNIVKTFYGHLDLIYDITWANNHLDYDGENDDDKEIDKLEEKKYLIATVSGDGTAKIWSLNSNSVYNDIEEDKNCKEILSWQHTNYVYTCQFHPVSISPMILITGGYDGAIRFWNVNEGSELKQYKLTSHSARINALVFDKFGEKLFSGDGDGCLKIWSNNANANETSKLKFELIHSIDENRNRHKQLWKGAAINCLRVHPSGRKLLLQARNSCLVTIELKMFTILNNFVGIENINYPYPLKCDYSSDGKFVICGSEDGRWLAWNADNGERITTNNLNRNDSVNQDGKGGEIVETTTTIPPKEPVYRDPIVCAIWHPIDDIIAVCSFGSMMPPVMLYGFDSNLQMITSKNEKQNLELLKAKREEIQKERHNQLEDILAAARAELEYSRANRQAKTAKAIELIRAGSSSSSSSSSSLNSSLFGNNINRNSSAGFNHHLNGLHSTAEKEKMRREEAYRQRTEARRNVEIEIKKTQSEQMKTKQFPLESEKDDNAIEFTPKESSEIKEETATVSLQLEEEEEKNNHPTTTTTTTNSTEIRISRRRQRQLNHAERQKQQEIQQQPFHLHSNLNFETLDNNNDLIESSPRRRPRRAHRVFDTDRRPVTAPHEVQAAEVPQ